MVGFRYTKGRTSHVYVLDIDGELVQTQLDCSQKSACCRQSDAGKWPSARKPSAIQ